MYQTWLGGPVSSRPLRGSIWEKRPVWRSRVQESKASFGILSHWCHRISSNSALLIGEHAQDIRKSSRSYLTSASPAHSFALVVADTVELVGPRASWVMREVRLGCFGGVDIYRGAHFGPAVPCATLAEYPTLSILVPTCKFLKSTTYITSITFHSTLAPFSFAVLNSRHPRNYHHPPSTRMALNCIALLASFRERA